MANEKILIVNTSLVVWDYEELKYGERFGDKKNIISGGDVVLEEKQSKRNYI